jgi:RNA polymerase sigma factor (sigma-70 family)
MIEKGEMPMSQEKAEQATGDIKSGSTFVSTMSATMLMEMVARACTKDRRAFEILYEYYEGPLGKRIAYLIGDKDTAYELYQETFIRFWIHLPMQPPLSFEAWLYRIARNIALDHLRHKHKLEFLPLATEIDVNETGTLPYSEFLSATGHEENVCEMACVKQALSEMSPRYRICVLLQDLWGYSQGEIAQSLGISESAVSSNVSRGHKQLRTAYREMMRPDKFDGKEG